MTDFQFPRVLHGQRPDIQGLRAFAVLSVLFFHIDVAFMRGGYLGVDVFFVLSGFLITHIIYFDVLHGEKSLAEFYVGRVRRLLPAALATALLSVAAGAFLFSTNELSELGASALHAILSLSNFFFWLDSGYFDQGADMKPLLHTWSLAVEEQFYLVWPALILLASRAGRNGLAILLITCSIGSLGGAEALLSRDATATFYLAPFRVFEFAAGAFLCFMPTLDRYHHSICSAAFAIGFGMLVTSVVLLDMSYPMPGITSLVPVVGTVLCILGGKSPAAAAFRSFPARFLGDISYSLYLVHWPLIVYWKYEFGSELSIIEQVASTFCSVLLAYALHTIVEKPLRREAFWSNRAGIPRLLLAMLVVVGGLYLCASAWATNGWPWRIPIEVRKTTLHLEDLKKEVAEYRERAIANPSESPPGKRVLIIGDSHAGDLLISFHRNDARHVRLLWIPYRCQPVIGDRPVEEGTVHFVVVSEQAAKECISAFQQILNHDLVSSADAILIAPRWKNWAIDRIPETISALRGKTDAEIVLFGPHLEFKSALPRIVEKYGRIRGIDEFARKQEDRERRAVSERLRSLSAEIGVLYVDKFRVICGKEIACPVFLPGTDQIIIRDSSHWTLPGADYFGMRMKSEYPKVARLVY